tara:strand:- start:812 stop:1381 length:570 start_codon:yes stop_codon:yes gene_type:complete
MKTLTEVYKKYSTDSPWGDKGTGHSYIPIYDRYITKTDSINFLEIGVCFGHSLAMWGEYLTNSNVYGMDNTDQISTCLDKKTYPAEDHNYKFLLGDSTTQESTKLIDGIMFDYILDDGSHVLQHQIKTFLLYWPYLKEGGTYFIEDINNIDYARGVLKETFEDITKDVHIYDGRYQTQRSDDVIIIINK